jgi:hypothetical protein
MSGTFEDPELEETFAEWKKLELQVQREEKRPGHKTDPAYLEIVKRRDELAKKLTPLPDD